MEVPKIFESEYRFCEILWAHEPVTSSELVRLCNEALEWKKSTTYTVIRRLSERGVLKSEGAVVTSLVSREDVQSAESAEVVERTFSGSLPSFVAAFMRKRISQDRKSMRFKRLLMRIRISLCKRLRFLFLFKPPRAEWRIGMEKLFLNLFHMSISAGYLILAVLLVRFLLRKVPKSMRMFLWILVGIRLIFPFSVESVFSLIPDTKAVYTYIGEMEQPTGEAAENTDSKKSVSQPIQQNTYPVSGEMVRHKSRTAVAVGMKIWIAGMALMLGYMLYSYLHLRNRVKMSVPADAAAVGCGVINDKNDSVRLYQSDDIESPFLFGILRPRIYIPCNISGDEILYVIQHELTHKRRKDYLIKPLGYLLLSVHWFNPCVWAAYAMFCKDIELICDEHVVRALGAEHKKAYSQALLNSAAKHRMAAACPIAFGEVSVKERVKNVLHYQKPAFWMLAAAVLACIIVPVCFMTQKKRVCLYKCIHKREICHRIHKYSTFKNR